MRRRPWDTHHPTQLQYTAGLLYVTYSTQHAAERQLCPAIRKYSVPLKTFVSHNGIKQRRDYH